MFDQYTEPSTKIFISERLKYQGKGLELALLMYKNLALTILTFGIYAAWGRTNTRRYLWGNISLLGDRGAYTGTGKELFRGWALVGVIYLGAAIILNVIGAFLPKLMQPFVGILFFPLYLYIYALVIYGGSRYRLARTKWRETHFGMVRNNELTRDFVGLVFKGVFLSLITLGLYFPIFQNAKRKFLIDKARFGTSKFRFKGRDSEYYKILAKGIFLTILTFGFYGSWMMLELLQYKLRNTTFDKTLFFRIHLKGSDIFKFSVLSYLATIFTLGLALPWIINKSYHLFVNSVEVFGEVDFNSIHNIQSEGSAVADVASVEYDFDLGF